ncbi:MAG: hypothetical protein KC493_08460 [Bacteriovoracaceae bacterium]|nr:hypothetical protein [Bacteriovoracaceae bacterium]
MGINKDRPKEISFDQDKIEASLLISLDEEELLLDECEGNLLLEDHHFESDLVVDELKEWENLYSDLNYGKLKGHNGKRLKRCFFILSLVALFGSFIWFFLSSLESIYFNSMSFISEGLKKSREQHINWLQKDKRKLIQTFDHRPSQPMGEIEKLNEKKTTKVKHRRKKRFAEISPVIKKAHVHKPGLLLNKSEKETILNEIEILILEARLDPFSARKDLINLKVDLKDKDLKEVIDNVLRQI